ncbi:nucleoside-diphosphate kinase [Candidatus Micrarchaeota archaeon]|nr:nucleoside-diphosphate kinase [Candidatus Micrarchaeota archaeon]
MAQKLVERTFVMVKPDGVQRGIVGDCLRRFENAGLKIVAMKLVHPTPAFIEKHYPSDDGWLRMVGEKSASTFRDLGIPLKQKFGTEDTLEIGKQIKKWLVKYISSGPVVAMAIEGYRAIENVRRITGPTKPFEAAPGTIRGDYSLDDPGLGNALSRPLLNIIHASGNKGEADNELALWFRKDDFMTYKRLDEDMWYKDWS